jgi:fructoselysine-6-P-deglycase FrlB-like protein
MPFNPHSFLQEEILTQPDDWARVLSRVDEARAALPPVGARLAVVGCGTSFYMAQAYAALRERAGQGETDAFAASEHRLHRGYDAVLVITRSGTTTEVLEVLTELRGSGTPTTAIVATAGTPATELADRVILLSEVDEQSVVQTRFATTALALLRASLGEDLTGAIADARAVLAQDEAQALAGLADAGQLTFLGRGWTVGLAEEAGLKLRESAQLWTESYPAMEYRHGPISIAAPGGATWAFGEVPEGLAEQVEATGAHFEHRDIDPMADLVRLHRLCLAKARQADVDPDNPRSLTRSIVLSDAVGHR